MLTAVIHWNKSDRLTPVTAHIGMNSICFRFLNVFFPPAAHAKTYFPTCLSEEWLPLSTRSLRRSCLRSVDDSVYMRPTGSHVPGHSPNSSGTATEKPLEAGASRGFSFWPKTDERPFPIALARRATMDAAFSDACVRILNVTGCAGQAEPARGMGARQAAISDSRRRGQTGSEILPALLKRLGLAPQYGRSAHALTSKRPGTPMVPGLSHGSCLAGF